MTRIPILASALCLVMGVAACTVFDEQPAPKTLPPPAYEPVPGSGRALPPPAPTAPATGEGVNQGGTYPYGTAQPTAPAAPAEDESVVVRTPDGRLWRKAGTTEEQRQADIAACYELAVAQVRRDERILADRDSGFRDFGPSSRFATVERQMQSVDLKNRRSRVMNSCLESKGYFRL